MNSVKGAHCTESRVAQGLSILKNIGSEMRRELRLLELTLAIRGTKAGTFKFGVQKRRDELIACRREAAFNVKNASLED